MFESNQFGLQDAYSPRIEEFTFFHDYLMLVLLFVITRVTYFLGALIGPRFTHRGLLEGQLLESVWTVAPTLILILIAIPSLTILYRLGSSNSSSLALKVMGYQWYWSYEYTDFWGREDSGVSFASYIISQRSLKETDTPASFTLPNKCSSIGEKLWRASFLGNPPPPAG